MTHRERLKHIDMATQLAERVEELQVELLRAKAESEGLRMRMSIALGFLKIRHVRRARKVLESTHEA